MRTLASTLLLIFSISASGQSELVDEPVSHLWVNGVYVNQTELPNWGFLVNVQEETFFAAIFGYDNSGSPTFIDLVGSRKGSDPLTYAGDVLFFTANGSNRQDVGNFSWSVSETQAAPSASLTITSNILNRSSLNLSRWSFAESDKIDMVTGGDWYMNITIFSSFAENYRISDARFTDDGQTVAEVYDNSSGNAFGLMSYDEDSNTYFLLMDYNTGFSDFYAFVADDTSMYGRNWLLQGDEEISGSGSYFRGFADSLQSANLDPFDQSAATTFSVETLARREFAENQLLKIRSQLGEGSKNLAIPLFQESTVSSQLRSLKQLLEKRQTD